MEMVVRLVVAGGWSRVGRVGGSLVRLHMAAQGILCWRFSVSCLCGGCTASIMRRQYRISYIRTNKYKSSWKAR